MKEAAVGKRYSAREDVVFTDLDDGSAVLLHLETKFYFSLNETGCFLWKLLDSESGITQEELIDQMCLNFDVEPAVAKSDVVDFLRDLGEQGLVSGK